MDLGEFLLARIAEDEDWAAEATKFGNDHWSADDLDTWKLGGESQPMTHAESVHIARHDPARVLAECEAKRQIITLMREGYTVSDVEYWALHDALQQLALPYAEHPDYDEAWKPAARGTAR